MHFHRVKRREFITLLGGAATWPLGARAQQPTMPVIGYVNSGTVAANPNNVAAFRLSLKEAGFTEGQNVAIEFRWAENQFDRLPALVGDLIQRPVTVIVGNTLAAAQAKVATQISCTLKPSCRRSRRCPSPFALSLCSCKHPITDRPTPQPNLAASLSGSSLIAWVTGG